MGTWGPGVWDNDYALDFRDDVRDLPREEQEAALLSDLTSALEQGIEIEDTDILLAAVAMLMELYQESGRRPPLHLDRQQLAERMLEAYDVEIDALMPAPGHKEARRAVMDE